MLSVTVYAQQLPQYSQYLRNQYMINPASAGVYDFTDVTLSGRWQWVGFDNSPRTTYLSATRPLKKLSTVPINPGIRTGSGVYRNPEVNTGVKKHAVGGQIIADQYGAFQKISLSGTYAIHFPISKRVNFSFGTKLGLSTNSFLEKKAIVNDASIDNSYQKYISNNKAKYILDIGAGVYVYSNEFFFGISADQLTQDFVKFGKGTAFFNPRTTFFATGGYKIKLNQDYSLTPALIAKYVYPSPISIEGTIALEYKEWMWGGFSYRHKDAIIGMFGMNLSNKFKIGYSYDYTLSRINKFSSGGHELILGIMIGR